MKRVAFFCTMGGSGAETAFGQLRQELGLEPVATLALTDREIDAGEIEAKLKAVADELRNAERTVSRAPAAEFTMRAARGSSNAVRGIPT